MYAIRAHSTTAVSLTLGSRVGSYEIISPLGTGGMGEVYRAHDLKLNRDVAIKVLTDLFAADPERLARFQREAQVLAALNHPNIAQIHGLEESNPSTLREPQGRPEHSRGTTSSGQAAVCAIVMELVEGPTLADILWGLEAGGLGLGDCEPCTIGRQLPGPSPQRG